MDIQGDEDGVRTLDDGRDDDADSPGGDVHEVADSCHFCLMGGHFPWPSILFH